MSASVTRLEKKTLRPSRVNRGGPSTSHVVE